CDPVREAFLGKLVVLQIECGPESGLNAISRYRRLEGGELFYGAPARDFVGLPFLAARKLHNLAVERGDDARASSRRKRIPRETGLSPCFETADEFAKAPCRTRPLPQV